MVCQALVANSHTTSSFEALSLSLNQLPAKIFTGLCLPGYHELPVPNSQCDIERVSLHLKNLGPGTCLAQTLLSQNFVLEGRHH